MKTPWVLALLLLAFGTGDLFACGDKIVNFTRGSRYQHAKDGRPAAILVYANPQSDVPEALANLPVDQTLRKAGFRPTIVTDAASFERALSQGGWDIILVDAAQGAALRDRLRGKQAPVVISVLHNATKPQLKEAKKLHQAVLKTPTKPEAFVETIDETLASRPEPHSGQ